MKFGSKRAIFGVIWGGFEGFGPCLGFSHPTHPHLGERDLQKKVCFLLLPICAFGSHLVVDFHSADIVAACRVPAEPEQKSTR